MTPLAFDVTRVVIEYGDIASGMPEAVMLLVLQYITVAPSGSMTPRMTSVNRTGPMRCDHACGVTGYFAYSVPLILCIPEHDVTDGGT